MLRVWLEWEELSVDCKLLPVYGHAGAPRLSISDLYPWNRIGALGAGGMTNANPGGWRWIFWTQAIFHGLTSVGLFAFYWPPKNIEYPKM